MLSKTGKKGWVSGSISNYDWLRPHRRASTIRIVEIGNALQTGYEMVNTKLKPNFEIIEKHT